MAEHVSFDELKRATTILHVAGWLGLELKSRSGNELRGSCPKHGSDRGLAIYPNYKNRDGSIGRFTCFACIPRGDGDLIGLIAHVQGIDIRAAALFLKSHLWPQQELKELDYLIHDAEQVADLGMPAHVAKALGVGFAKRGTMAGRVCFPLRLPDGKLVAYLGVNEAGVKLPKNFFV